MTTAGAEPPPGWREAALGPPHALGPPVAQGVLRAAPADFNVEEQLGFEPDGGSGHWLLRVEKTAANTLAVARALARHAGTRATDVGFAGLKDYRAVATQWFSVPATRGDAGWQDLQGQGFRVLEAHPHSRKLRRGALAGNRFRIRVARPAGATREVDVRLAAIAARGVPNYFGAQRFGVGGSNLLRVARWLEDGRLPRSRDERSFALSAARSLMFNGVLGARVRAGNWDRLLQGEILNLDGTGSVFADDRSAGLQERIARGDLHPTGPLPGRGGTRPAGAAAAFEAAALEPYGGLVEALVTAGVDAQRRALRVLPRDLDWAWEGNDLALSFVLPRGAFATSVLREVVSEVAVDGDPEGSGPP